MVDTRHAQKDRSSSVEPSDIKSFLAKREEESLVTRVIGLLIKVHDIWPVKHARNNVLFLLVSALSI